MEEHINSRDGRKLGIDMDKKKLAWQIAILALAVLCFAGINIWFYEAFVKKVISHHTPGMQAMSVEVKDYVPFAGTGHISSVPEAKDLEGTLPRIDGAAALLPVYAGFVESVYPEDSVVFDGEGFAPESYMQYTNTRGAYQAIAEGDADIIICAAPSDEQIKYAEEMGVELEMVPIGMDAFVFIVNSSNPVDGLTLEQIRGIYSGQIDNWSEVGGDNMPIAALRRNEGSGSQTALESLMGDIPVRADYTTLGASPIGFSFRYYVTGMLKEGGVKMLAVDGVEPDITSIANGTYPATEYIYAIYRRGETNPNVTGLIDFMLSPEGQAIVERSGYVPIE